MIEKSAGDGATNVPRDSACSRVPRCEKSQAILERLDALAVWMNQFAEIDELHARSRQTKGAPGRAEDEADERRDGSPKRRS